MSQLPIVVDENAQLVIMIPTAVNLGLMIAENLTANLRLNQASNIVLPSIYKRAYLVVNETDEIGALRQQSSSSA